MESGLADSLLSLPYVIEKTSENGKIKSPSNMVTIINRKEDRFTLTRRELVSELTPSGKRWSRWRSSESVTVSIKTPKYLGFPTVCAFHKTKSGLKNITPKVADVRSIFSEFEQEYNALILRNFYKENSADFDYISFNTLNNKDLKTRLIQIHYPLLTHVVGDKAFEMPEPLIRNIAKIRDFETFISYLGYQQENLIKVIKDKYDNNTLTLNDIAILTVCLNKTYNENSILIMLKMLDNEIFGKSTDEIYVSFSECKPEQLRGVLKKTSYLTFLNGIKNINSRVENQKRFIYLTEYSPKIFKSAIKDWSDNYKLIRASKKRITVFSPDGISKYTREHERKDAPIENVKSRFLDDVSNNSLFHIVKGNNYYITNGLRKNYELYKKLKPVLKHKTFNRRGAIETYVISGEEQNFINIVETYLESIVNRAGFKVEDLNNNSRKNLFNLVSVLNHLHTLGMDRYKGKIPKVGVRMIEMGLPTNLVMFLLKKNITNSEVLLMKDLPYSQIASIYGMDSYSNKNSASFDF